MTATALLLFPVLGVGCAFEEHLPQVDIPGTVIVPREAAIPPGETEPDVRFLGPVWLGVFPDVNTTDFDYPHPEIGPVIGELAGNTYPYGGGSAGRFDFACYESIKCRMTTGRFMDFEDILDFFENVAGTPITDDQGNIVDSADYFRASCYDLFNLTDDVELSFISCPEGRDDCNGGLTFEENADGDFEASFDLWQVTYQQDMKVWGWVDTPTEDYEFSTCDPNRGQRNSEYNADYYYGASYTNLLNYPDQYIGFDDYVVQDPHVFSAEDADAFRESPDEVVLRVDFHITD